MRTEQEIRELIEQLGPCPTDGRILSRIHQAMLNILQWVLNEENTNG
jgi:hypothetical protein